MFMTIPSATGPAVPPTAVALALCTLLALAPAHAQQAQPLDIRLSYTVSTDGTLPAITNIITFNSYADTSTGSWFAARVPAASTATVIDDPFLKSSANAPRDALMLGLVQDLPGDAPGQEHLVLMLANAAAGAARQIAWGTLFRQTLEADLIAALHTDTSGLPFEQIQPEIDKLYTFAGGDARSGILGTTMQPIDAWFALPGVGPGQVATTGFTVMAFSDGQILGDGVATVSAVAEVPEPQPGAMLLAGLAALGWLARRRTATGGALTRPGDSHGQPTTA